MKNHFKLLQLKHQADTGTVTVMVDGVFCIKRKVVNKYTHRLNSILVCGICTREFDKRCNLKDHLRIHSGHKPFRCTDCGKCFKQKAQLSKHQRRHSRDAADIDLDEEEDEMENEMDQTDNNIE